MTRGSSDALCKVAPGSVITQEISGGESRTCAIHLSARQYLQLTINKGDLKLAASLYGPNGEKLFEYLDRSFGELKLSLVAESPGEYLLEVRSLENEPASKSYELRAGRAGNTTAREIKEYSALKLFAEANNLRARWEKEALREALEKLAQARLVWRSVGEPRRAAEALASAAEIHVVLSEYRQARGLYQQAVSENRRLLNRRGEFAAINRLGLVYSYLGDNDRAEKYLAGVLRYYERQRAAPQPAEDKRLNAESLTNMGVVAYSKGDLVRASEFINRALALWSDVADRGGEAHARLALGYALSYAGDRAKAVSQFNQAMALYRAVEDRRGENLALTVLGTLHSLAGEEQAALEAHREAMRVFRAIGDRQSEGVTLIGVGQVYEDLNEKETALDNYQQALKLFELNGSLDFAAGAEYEIARMHRALNDDQQALAHYNRCVSLSRRTNKRRTEAYALKDIAAVLDAQGRRRETLETYDDLLKLYRELGDLRGQAMTLASIGDLFFAAGEKDKATGFYKQSLPLMQAVGDKDGETSTLYNMARAARDRDALDEALSLIEQSIRIIENLRTHVSSPDLRASYFESVHKHYGFYIDLLMQLERRRPGNGFAALALRASESARARSLLELLGEVNIDIRQGVDQKLLEQEQRLEQLLNAKAQYQVELPGSKRTQAEAAEAAREMRQLTAEYQAVQAQLRERSPRYAALTRPTPIDLKAIQSEILDGDTLLLEYFLGEERSYLWVVSRDSFGGYELPARATLEDAAREVYGLLTARQLVGEKMDAAYQERVAAADRQYGEKALALSRTLLGPAAAQLGDKRLLIVAEGALQYIPFDALPVPGAGADAGPEAAEDGLVSGGRPLLGDRHQIVNLPSVSTLVAIRSERPPVNSPSKIVAILADPVFESDDPRVQEPDTLVASGAPGEALPADTPSALRDFYQATGSPHIPRLPYTLEEAAAVTALTPPDERLVATGFEASRETVMNSPLDQYQVVHFATHGFINDDHPELSGILLSLVDKNGKPGRGFLQLHDIYTLNLSAKLVVLSACSTGLGKDVKGEGFVGLTRGFIYAGSKCVVASLWKVDDRATAELMGHFYRAMLKDKLPPAEALRVAKKTLRAQSRWRAPFFWAAFVLQGEYDERVRLTDDSKAAPYLIPSLAALVCLLSLLYFKRRRR